MNNCGFIRTADILEYCPNFSKIINWKIIKNTILILGSSPCGRLSNLRDEPKIRYGIFRPISVIPGMLKTRCFRICFLENRCFIFLPYSTHRKATARPCSQDKYCTPPSQPSDKNIKRIQFFQTSGRVLTNPRFLGKFKYSAKKL